MAELNAISLRHTLATLAYRANRAIRNAPAEFAGFPDPARSASQILAHIGDLLEWALSMANGKQAWRNSAPLPWDEEVQRFFAALEMLDHRLASNEPIACSAERLFQGPIADALTHVGQIAMLRRMAGCPIGGENYFVADIATGRVGPDPAKPVQEL